MSPAGRCWAIRKIAWLAGAAMHRAVLEAARDCDLIHVQTPFIAHYAGLKAARQLGLPVVATYHTLFEEYLQHYAKFIPSGWLRGQARAFSRRQCNQLDAVIVPSTAMRQRLDSYGVNVAPCMCCRPASRWRSSPVAMARLSACGMALPRTGRWRCLWAGWHMRRTSVSCSKRLVHARQMRPDTLLVIAGEGPAMNDLKAQTEALGLLESVIFIGYLDRKKALPDCYAAADVFVFASRTETQGLVLIEALAAGVPVIALSEMGTTDILAPGRGAFSPPVNPKGVRRNARSFPQSSGRLAPPLRRGAALCPGMDRCGDGREAGETVSPDGWRAICCGNAFERRCVN